MAQWSLTLAVPETGELPVFVRIAQAITDDIRRGRLRAGDALPGSRPLATSLGVHRNTVLAAYRELGAEGWITTSEAKGTFVAGDIPRPVRFAAHAAAMAARPGFDVPPDEEALDAHVRRRGKGPRRGAHDDARRWRSRRAALAGRRARAGDAACSPAEGDRGAVVRRSARTGRAPGKPRDDARDDARDPGGAGAHARRAGQPRWGSISLPER